MKLSLLFFHIVLIFTITACGYKPSSHYAKEQLNGKIFVNLIIDLEDPRNAVLIKDAMNELIVHRLDSKIVYDRKLADTVMNVKLNSVRMQVLQDDAQGYNKLYKAVVGVLVDYSNEKGKKSFTVSGDYDFSIDNGTTITDTKRFEAIKNAASEALEEIISKLAVNSFKK
ncbi:LPS assembly lipoprotein LptE [Arcobacter sp. LA11]|uniref:LPS assembly lipoprotein LptE n=1 Tax=Arcobacter sp. LA11 TaxID=1898176 RepID=UPI00093535BE|nr:LPS assembly lipoprotein LptE [Arcobacter sp. LA11]